MSSDMRQRGFSLIELMVVIVIALLLSLAISNVMSSNEAFKRTTTATADASQNGNYAVYVLDKAIRNGGSGFRQGMGSSYGCPLTAYSGGTARLPITAAASQLPQQFQNLNAALGGVYVMAPVLIAKNASMTGTSDALVVMSGASGYGELPYAMSAAPGPSNATTGTVNLVTTLGMHPSDMLLVAQVPAAPSGVAMPPCAIEEVATTYSAATDGTVVQLPLSGNFFSPNVGGTAVSALATSTTVMNMGNELSDSPPSLQLFTVGYPNNGAAVTDPTLYSYDLLQIQSNNGPTVATGVTDGVLEMHAIYGIASLTQCLDTKNNGTPYPCPITAWVDPGTAPWDIATLTNQNNAKVNNASLYLIKAVRLGLILRSPVQEKTAVTTNGVILFNDLSPAYPTPYTRNFNGAEQFYRYRTIEVTIPVRNNGIP